MARSWFSVVLEGSWRNAWSLLGWHHPKHLVFSLPAVVLTSYFLAVSGEAGSQVVREQVEVMIPAAATAGAWVFGIAFVGSLLWVPYRDYRAQFSRAEDEQKRADELRTQIDARRPHFSVCKVGLFENPVIETAADGQQTRTDRVLFRLGVDYRNDGDHGARGLRGQVAVMAQQLEEGHLVATTFGCVNEIASGATDGWVGATMPVDVSTPPLYLFFSLEYNDVVDESPFFQAWYFQWPGVDDQQQFASPFFGLATEDQRNRIDDYLRARGVSLGSPTAG